MYFEGLYNEAQSVKENREQKEKTVQHLLSESDACILDLPDIRAKSMHEYAKERGYQVSQRSLRNRYAVYKQRYPMNFGTFLRNTNEKELTLQVMNQLMNNILSRFPSYFSRGLKMFDVGCGNGQFSNAMVSLLGKILPRGARDITFDGIDVQESFIKTTNELIRKQGAQVGAMVGDFRNDAVPSAAEHAYNFIMASHSAYVFSDMNVFVEKIELMLAKDGIAVLLHNGDTAINAFRKKFSHILKQSVTSNTVANIENALKKVGADYLLLDFKPIIKFPKLTNKEWKLLRAVELADYAADYSAWKPQAFEAKKLIEFFLQDPLESFTHEQRNNILAGFKELLVTYNYEIPLLNHVHIIIARNNSPEFKKALAEAVTMTKAKIA